MEAAHAPFPPVSAGCEGTPQPETMTVTESGQTVFDGAMQAVHSVAGVQRVEVRGTKLEIEVISGDFSFTVKNPA